MSSPNNTYAVGIGATVTDADGSVYAINADNQITINGDVDWTTGRVDLLGYADGVVWQKNADNSWYSKTNATAVWGNYTEINGNPPFGVAPSPTEWRSPPGYAYGVHDTQGNVWAINAEGVVVVDNASDLTTDRVIGLTYVNGVIWQENADGNWYSKVNPSDTWTQATRAEPVLAARANALTWTGATTDPTDPAAWALADGTHQTPVAHQTLIMNEGGTLDLGGDLSGDTLYIGDPPGVLDQYRISGAIINLTDGAALKLNADIGTAQVHVTGCGSAALDIHTGFYGPPGGGTVVVTADMISTVLLHADMSFGQLTVNGGTIVVAGGMDFHGTQVLLNCDLAGTGTISAVHGGRYTGNVRPLEVTGSIGSGVTLAADPLGTLILDKPAADQGSVTLKSAMLEIRNAATADSVSYKDSLVSLYQGSSLLASVKVVGLVDPFGFGSPSDGGLHFSKSDSSGSVFVSSSGPGVHELALTALTLTA